MTRHPSSLIVLIAGAFLGGPAAYAQGPSPDIKPKPVPVASVKVPDGPLYAGDLIELDGSASVGDSLDCEVVSPPDLTTFRWDPVGKVLSFANRKPGVYVFRFEAESIVGTTIADARSVKSRQRVILTTVDPNPPVVVVPPSPINPSPVNPVTPAVALYAGPLDVTLIYDLDSIQFSTTPVRVSSIATDLKSLDATWYALTSDSTYAAPFVARMKLDGIAVPVVYVTDRSGKLWATITAPRSEADVVTKIKAIRGTK